MVNLYYIKYQFSIDKSGFNTMAKKEVYSLFVELGTPPLDDYQDVDAAFQKHLKEQFDRYFLSEGFKHTGGRRRYNIGRPICNSQFVILQWQDLNDDDKFKARAGSFFKDYPAALEEVQSIIKEAKGFYNEITQLDSGAPDPLLVSQTPEPDAAPKDAAQPPAASKQTGKDLPKKPRAGSGGRKQNNFKLPAGDAGINTLLDILRYLRDRKTQKWIAGKIGFDESNWNKEGTLGECLRKLKQRAEQYPNKEDSDWLACAALSKGLNEAELDLDKDINRREVPMGVMNDRDQWEK